MTSKIDEIVSEQKKNETQEQKILLVAAAKISSAQHKLNLAFEEAYGELVDASNLINSVEFGMRKKKKK